LLIHFGRKLNGVQYIQITLFFVTADCFDNFRTLKWI